jgi:hypothetical protein
MTTGKRRIIVGGLAEFEINIARSMIQDNRLPMFNELKERAAIFALDHGPARAWEHFSTGQSLDAYLSL